MKEVFAYLQKCHVYYLATVEGDQPRVRPFGALNMFEDKIYIQTGKVKDVSKQIAANHKVEICAFDQENGTWIRVAGELIRDERIEAKESMLDANPSLKNRYSATDDNTEVLYFQNATATITGFAGEPKIIKF